MVKYIERSDKQVQPKTDDMIGIRVTKEFKDKLQERADFEGRSLANLVKRACEKYLADIEEAKVLLKK